jgi:ribonuclease HII
MLSLKHNDKTKYELCIDEVGRGCLFGRAYIACVVLPSDGSFDGTNIKDSKKFTSKKKIKAVADYIQSKALFWHIAYVENDVIDNVNILQAVMKGMHECIDVIKDKITKDANYSHQLEPQHENEFMAVIDGNYFKPYLYYDETTNSLKTLPSVTVEKGDATYMGIAAASILAKVARDEYILDLCEKTPTLKEHYSLHTNMGYGTKAHMEGIEKHGITELHRKTFRHGKNNSM